MNEKTKTALDQLERLDPEKARAVLTKLREKRRDEQFIKYWQATEKQAEKIHQFTEDIKIFGVLGGNRSGKTELGGVIATAWALGKDFFRDEPIWEFVKGLPIPEPPNNIWVVGLDYGTLRDVIWREKLRFGLSHPPLVPKDPSIVTKANDGEFQIFFANGSIITGKSADAGREKFQGASVNLVWIDEEPESDIFEECYQRTSDCAGKILLTLTPLTDIASGVRTPWVHDLYTESLANPTGDVKFVQLSVLDNPYVPEVEKEKLKEFWAGHPEENARLYGEFFQRSGLVYPMWDRKVHLIDPIRLDRDALRIISIDPAATGRTAAVAAAIYGNGDMYLYDEYYEKDLIVSQHAKNMLVRFEGPIDIWLIDPKWGTQRNAETHRDGASLYRESGIPVRLAKVDEDYGLNASREYLNATVTSKSRTPRVFVFKTLKNFQTEIEHYTWATFSKGDNKGLSKDKPVKKNDHLMNAWQYICAMRPRGKRTANLSDEERRKLASLNSYT